MDARRDFLKLHLPVGFALAVQPIAAQTVITTDTAGLTAGEVQIPTKDGKSMPAYRAMPARGSKFPIVLVVEEIFGIHEYIKDICRRWAKLGYLAVAPDLFMRQGDVTQIKEISEIIAKVVSKVPDEQVMSDLDATFEWAAKNRGDTNKLAVTGYCWGGRITWLYAAHQPKVKAGGAWYGVLTRPTSPLQPKHPLDIAPQLKAPVLGLYGGQDRGIPLDTVEKMKEALAKGSSGSQIIVYPDAPHGFHADYRESYRKADAEDAWNRLTAWFKKHGVA
ncbi:MAG: dienelactone hydrolase family protein [Bryobacteraceae bacterium]|nr:dienelactone hydrolase family protein [Bryobacteraceae bacterium]MDW8376847.1 dienelactone hydrolase family protein [Bryobacterales bacterium]